MHFDSSPGEAQAPPASLPQKRSHPARFLSVGATAQLLGMSEATLYRAIRADEFPAIQVRNRYSVPAKVLDYMEDAALAAWSRVNAADFVTRKAVA